MTPHKPAWGTIFQINMALLGAAAFGFTAWVIWPNTPKWWGFGLMSIMLAISAPAMLIKAFILMVKLYQRDKALAEFEAANRDADPSELANDDVLRKAGMKK